MIADGLSHWKALDPVWVWSVLLRLVLQPGSFPGGSFICHPGEHEARKICVSSPGSIGSSLGYLHQGLLQVEEDLSCSTLDHISRVLIKLGSFEVPAILMAPHWPAQLWFQLLSSRANSSHRLPHPCLFQGWESRLAPSCLDSQEGTVG